MLSLPRFTRSLLDSLDDSLDFQVFPLDYLLPSQQLTGAAAPQLQMAMPTIKNNKYNLSLDLRNFDPTEINVKYDKNSLQVSGKHEKKTEDGHYEFREYKHYFSVPDSVDHEQLKCHLDKQGVLKIEAPVKAQAIEDLKGKSIPIEYVGKKK